MPAPTITEPGREHARFWAHAAPWDTDTADPTTHFAAMAMAHLEAWTRCLSDRVQNPDHPGIDRAAGTAQHWKPFVAAYTAAALLRGQSIHQIRRHLLAGDVVREQLGDWLSDAGFTPEQITALSVLPPALQTMPGTNPGIAEAS